MTGPSLRLVACAACAAFLLTAASAKGDDGRELPAIRLLKEGRAVRPVTGAGNMADYLRALAASAGTEAVQSYVSGRLARRTPAPVPGGKASRPAFEWLAEALTGKPAALAVDPRGQWCIYEHGDPGRQFSYAARGGILCGIDHFTRSATGGAIVTITHLVFDPEAAREVVATRMAMEVVEAVSEKGERFVPADDRKRLGSHWCENQQTISLPADRFPGHRTARLRVRGQLAVRTGVATFEVKSLGHPAPRTFTQSGVTVTVHPLREEKRQGRETWNVPVEVRVGYDTPAGLTAHGEQVRFLATDGKVLPRTGWSGRHSRGVHEMTLRIPPHTIDPPSTRMVLEYPTGLEIFPFELTFENVEIQDATPRPAD